jgi:hypothetical protein
VRPWVAGSGAGSRGRTVDEPVRMRPRTAKDVDNSLPSPHLRRVQSVLPEGATGPKAVPQELASAALTTDRRVPSGVFVCPTIWCTARLPAYGVTAGRCWRTVDEIAFSGRPPPNLVDNPLPTADPGRVDSVLPEGATARTRWRGCLHQRWNGRGGGSFGRFRVRPPRAGVADLIPPVAR